MEARRLSLVSDYGDEGGGEEEERLSLAVWIFGLHLGPAQALCYGYLYGQTHGRGRHAFTCDAADLIKTFDRDRRTIEGWLAALEAQPAGLIRVDADPLTGQLRITVYRPTSFAPRRTTRKGRDPQKQLPGVEDGPVGDAVAEFEAERQGATSPVSPVEETKGQAVRPTDNECVAASAARTAAPPHRAIHEEPAGESLAAQFERAIRPAGQAGESSGVCAQKPPDASGVFARKPPSDDEAAILELQKKLERKRSQAFLATGDCAQKPPAHELLKISVSSFLETKNRDLRSAGDCAQKPPSRFCEGESFEAATRRIHRAVGPKLHRVIARRVAWAIVEGRLDGELVEAAILRAHDLVAEGRCDAAWNYFVVAMRRMFDERGIPWRPERRR